MKTAKTFNGKYYKPGKPFTPKVGDFYCLPKNTINRKVEDYPIKNDEPFIVLQSGFEYESMVVSKAIRCKKDGSDLKRKK